MSSKNQYNNRNVTTTAGPEVEKTETSAPQETQETQQPETDQNVATVTTPQVSEQPVTETPMVTTATPVVTTAAPEVTTAPVVAEDKTSTDAPVSGKGEESVFQSRILWIKENGSVNENHVVTVLENYVAVGLSSVNLNDIAVEQQRFWRLFQFIHNNPADFQKLFGLVVEFGKEYKDSLFNLSTLFRAQSGLSLSADQLVAFNNLRTLLLNTIQTNDVAKVKTLVDIRKIVEHDSIPENVRGMYVNFYG